MASFSRCSESFHTHDVPDIPLWTLYSQWKRIVRWKRRLWRHKKRHVVAATQQIHCFGDSPFGLKIQLEWPFQRTRHRLNVWIRAHKWIALAMGAFTLVLRRQGGPRVVCACFLPRRQKFWPPCSSVVSVVGVRLKSQPNNSHMTWLWHTFT